MGQYRSSFGNSVEERVDVTSTTPTLDWTHQGKTLYCASAGNTTVTVPPNSSVPYEGGTVIKLIRNHATNTLTVAAGGGVTIRNSGTALTAHRAWSVITLTKVGPDEWFLNGQVTGALT